MNVELAAPMPGIFYSRPSPEADPFLVPGDVIEVSTTVGVIEVMKMFMEIPAGSAGVFVSYPVDDGGLATLGAPIAVIEVDA